MYGFFGGGSDEVDDSRDGHGVRVNGHGLFDVSDRVFAACTFVAGEIDKQHV